MDPQIISKYADQLRLLSNGGGGKDGAVTCALASTGRVRSFTIHTAGTGYSVDDVLTADNGDGATFTVTTVDGSGGVTGAVLTTPGTGVTDEAGDATTVAPSGGTGCKLTLVAEFPIDTATIVDAGENYITALAVLSGGNGTGGVIELGVVDGEITTATVDPAGYYRTAPTIQVVAGPPADGAAYITQMTAFDTTLLYERLLDILGDAERTVIFNANAGAAIEEMRAALIAGL